MNTTTPPLLQPWPANSTDHAREAMDGLGELHVAEISTEEGKQIMKRTLSGELSPTPLPVQAGAPTGAAQDNTALPPAAPDVHTHEPDQDILANWMNAAHEELPDLNSLLQQMPHTPPILSPRDGEDSVEEFGEINLTRSFEEVYGPFLNQTHENPIFILGRFDYYNAWALSPEQRQKVARAIGTNSILKTLSIRQRHTEGLLDAVALNKEDDLTLPVQEFEDYKSKYLDIHDKVKKQRETDEASVLEDIDFELSLIHRDEINVAYILNLLVNLNKNLDPEEKQKRQKEIIDLVAGEVQLRSKRELIEKFIEENLPSLKPKDNVIHEFENYWSENKQKAFETLCAEENMVPEQLEQIVKNYGFYNRLPKSQDIGNALSFKPKILERKTILQRVGDKIQDFINTFIEGMG